MSVKYSKLPTEESDSTVIDFGSPLKYKSNEYPKYFSYSNNDNMYKSVFTYSGYRPEGYSDFDVPELTVFQKFCAGLITVICYALVLIGFPVTWWFCLKIVPQNERLVIYRLGRLLAVKQPGATIILPCLDRVTKIDMRTRAFSVPPQKIITSDGAIVEIGADIFFRVKDPVLSVSSIQDLNHSLRIIAVASLQKHFSKIRLNHIESDKSVTSSLLHTDINQMSLTWGVEVGKIELSQVKVLEEANPIVAAASGGNENPLAFLGQLFGNAGMPMPIGMSPTGAFSPVKQSLFEGQGGIRSPTMEPRHFVSVVQRFLSGDLVRQHGVVCKFDIIGEGGGVFYLDLKNVGQYQLMSKETVTLLKTVFISLLKTTGRSEGEGSAGEGNPGDRPDVTLTLTVDDMNSLFTGKISAFDAYMGGKLQIDGDLQAAMGLQDLVARVQRTLEASPSAIY